MPAEDGNLFDSNFYEDTLERIISGILLQSS